ncbi:MULTISPECIES: CHASE domain-containing protein [unclassified Leptolyngbya]|uniref:CHASE domain-containing sensor histidine kinase n=1 Tax=unclassified Leptolyngbya TaxID=2650499 RepID=UPI001682962F|nr:MULTISPECIES: CHASE domain-containing protein [unclassified Leptolyngbya]MBD1912569.1 CHASE domain-containing protein [Leptolyngbya sp. FACHB-8]MBD2158479.1 CHASE domain-containing protein [Leptolyngbya sp. FACHB-16]
MIKTFPHYRITVALTLFLGVGLSIFAATLVNQWEASRRQLQFQRQIENLGTALQRSVNRYTDMLAFLGDFYGASQEVDRQEFAEFAGRSLQIYSGIQALEWAPIVTLTERPTYERNLQASGFSGFQITELGSDGSLMRASDRPYYIPVTYLEPLAGNESALGYDLNSDATRGMAIAQARDAGKITATGRIRLVQETRDQFGFLVFLPLYRENGIPTSDTLQQRNLSSFLLGVFRVSDVVEEALQELQYDIDFSIYDQNAAPTEQFLGRYEAALQQVVTVDRTAPSDGLYDSLCPWVTNCSQTLAVGERKWQIVFSPATTYPLEREYGAIATLISGLLLTSGLVLFLHRLNRELEQTRSLNDLKSRFFSMASHELRTPLSTILLSSESLQLNQRTLSEEQKQANTQRIYSAAKRMGQQITDLLLLTRAEVGRLEFRPELLDVHEFCQQLLEEMQSDVPQTIQWQSSGSVKAFLDRGLLRSLLTNLLSNASKYSPSDAPIQFTLTSDGRVVMFEVSDRGIGIPVQDQSRIAETFYRGSNVGNVTGTGLGLAIVKTCVELHRGQWAIHSREGEGTTVAVTLPLE